MLELKRGQKYLDDILNLIHKQIHKDNIKKALREHGKEVIIALKILVSTGSRTGRVYMYRGSPYRASAPGEPPAKRSGKLSKGFRYRAGINRLRIGSNVFSDKGAPYPAWLEEGTPKGQMQPRPYFEKTIIRLEPLLHQKLVRAKI